MTAPAPEPTGDEETTAADNPPDTTGHAEMRRFPARPAPDAAEVAGEAEPSQPATETAPAIETAGVGADGVPDESQDPAPALPDGTLTAESADDAGSEPPPGEATVEVEAEGTASRDLVTVPAADLADLRAELAAVREALGALEPLRAQTAEVARLRARDADIVEKLHGENIRLRTGELASAMAPLLGGLLRLHDQMTSLASGDRQSVAGMLQTQLLQLLDTAAGVATYEPAAGEPFDARWHCGAGRVPTTDPAADGTVARTLKPGFARGDGSVVRVAEVEVYRHAPAPAVLRQAADPVPVGQRDESQHPTPFPADAGADRQENS